MKISSTPLNSGANVSSVANTTSELPENAPAQPMAPPNSADIFENSVNPSLDSWLQLSPPQSSSVATDNVNNMEASKQKLAGEWTEKMALVERGLSSADPKVRETAAEFKQHMIAQQAGLLADAVYQDSQSPAPTGWKDISNDPKALAEYGLKPSDFGIENTTFRARMFVPDSEVFGDTMKPTLAFKGTSSASDWKNNLQQGTNSYSEYYERAVHIGNQIKESGKTDSMNIAGHSLGGGLASAASVASGSDAYTFNAAGLHPATVSRYGGSEQNPNISAYQVKGEMLTGIQGTLPLAEARGTVFALPAAQGTEKTTANPIWQESFYPSFTGETTIPTMSGSVINHLGDAFKDGMQQVAAQSEAGLREHLGKE